MKKLRMRHSPKLSRTLTRLFDHQPCNYRCIDLVTDITQSLLPAKVGITKQSQTDERLQHSNSHDTPDGARDYGVESICSDHPEIYCSLDLGSRLGETCD